MSGVVFLALGLAPFARTYDRPPVPYPISRHVEKLAAAPGVKVRYTVDLAPYELTMAKPNRFRLDYPEGFVLSDGKRLFTYTKKDNRYTESPLTEADVHAFAERSDASLWSDYLAKSPGARYQSSMAWSGRKLQGHRVEVVFVRLATGDPASVFIDSNTGIARKFSSSRENEKSLIASEIELRAVAPQAFTFVAPPGAKRKPSS